MTLISPSTAVILTGTGIFAGFICCACSCRYMLDILERSLVARILPELNPTQIRNFQHLLNEELPEGFEGHQNQVIDRIAHVVDRVTLPETRPPSIDIDV